MDATEQIPDAHTPFIDQVHDAITRIRARELARLREVECEIRATMRAVRLLCAESPPLAAPGEIPVYPGPIKLRHVPNAKIIDLVTRMGADMAAVELKVSSATLYRALVDRGIREKRSRPCLSAARWSPRNPDPVVVTNRDPAVPQTR